MKLSDIKFPVYKLGVAEPLFEKGVYFYLYGKNTDNSDATYKLNILDDTNMPGESLAMRRLQLKKLDRPLHKLNKAIFFLGDFIKVANSSTWFIDTVGTVFQYTKSNRVKLIYREIDSIMPLKTGGAIISVKGVDARFKCLFAPTNNPTHAGLLVLKDSYILYGLYDKYYDPSYRII